MTKYFHVTMVCDHDYSALVPCETLNTAVFLHFHAQMIISHCPLNYVYFSLLNEMYRPVAIATSGCILVRV